MNFRKKIFVHSFTVTLVSINKNFNNTKKASLQADSNHFVKANGVCTYEFQCLVKFRSPKCLSARESSDLTFEKMCEWYTNLHYHNFACFIDDIEQLHSRNSKPNEILKY